MGQIREYKREMDLDPLVAEFRLAENDLQYLLDAVSMIVGGAVSPHIKVPTGNPFFDTGNSIAVAAAAGEAVIAVKNRLITSRFFILLNKYKSMN